MKKKTHLAHVNIVRQNRMQLMRQALAEGHNRTYLKKLNHVIKIDPELQEVFLHSLAMNESSTDRFLAMLESHKREKAIEREQNHVDGVNKRRGPRKPKAWH